MKKYRITVNGNAYEVEVEELGGNASAAPVAAAVAEAAPEKAPAPTPAPAAAPKATAEGEKIEAPLPGNILNVNVSAGQTVKKGDVLLVLEAMKMENEIMAPKDGKVLEVTVAKGAAVNTGDVLAVME